MDSIVSNLTVANVILAISAAALYYLIRKKWVERNLPPGPAGLPILGYIPLFGQHPQQDFIEMSKKYKSNIISVKLGMDTVIILNDLESVREVMGHEAAQARPRDMIFNLFNRDGLLVTWNGELWKQQRRFSLKTLRNLGFGKTSFEDKIIDEIHYLFDKIASQSKNGSQPVMLKPLLSPSASNIINLMISGDRYDFDHPIRQRLDHIFMRVDPEMAKFFSFTNYISYFPNVFRTVAYFATSTSIAKEFKDNNLFLMSYIMTKFEEHLKKDQNDGSDFMDLYADEVKQPSDSQKTTFSKENLLGCATAFFAAGSTTVKDMIEWFLVLMTEHQDVQEKMRSELETVIGTERNPTHADRQNMPYTEAVISEVLRFATSIPLNLPHRALDDIRLNSGHVVPRDAHIISNYYAIHHNSDVWGDPENFRPDRFLSPDGKKYVKSDHLIPFGYGKRSCPGEAMAQSEMFLYFTLFLKKFVVKSLVKDFKARAKTFGFSRIPEDAEELIFMPRGFN